MVSWHVDFKTISTFCNKTQQSSLFRSTQVIYTGYSQNNAEVSKVIKKSISHLTGVKRAPSTAATVQVSHALPAVRFSCLLRGHGVSFKAGVAAGKGFLCAPF
jgi:hypothetical protein